MANYSDIKEGLYISRPPLFDGTNYGYWKNRMSLYIQACDLKQWRVILNGPYVFTKKDNKGNNIPKLESEWDDQDIENFQYNARALNTLLCALSMDEYNKISSCKTAKEIWDKLELANEGSSQVKEDNINMLVHDYEIFEMNENESLISMYNRFLVITNDLSGLGKDFSNYDKIRKLLRVLPSRWRPKVTAIQEAKDLHQLSLDELIGSLKIHEKELARENKRDAKPIKNLALKANNNNDDSSSDSDESESNIDSSNDEEANLCLMVNNDNEVTSNFSSSDFDDSDNDNIDDQNNYDELFDMFEELHSKFEELTKRYATLKKQNSMISSQNVILEKENIDLKNEMSYLKKGKEKVVSETLMLENNELKVKVNDLTNNLAIFTNGKKNLDKLLGVQKCVSNKTGLGYNQTNNRNDHKSLFNSSTSYVRNKPRLHYKRTTHDVQHGYFKNKIFKKGKLAWVPKGTIMFANPKGPNTFWVPKEKLLKIIV